MYTTPKIRVGVLRGGPSNEHDVSLLTGENVLRSLFTHKYLPVDIKIARDGVWHLNGTSRKPEIVLRGVDVVFNAMHGEFGEDGAVQRILDSFAVPYTGSQAFASMLSMNKVATKEKVRAEDIKVPLHKILRGVTRDEFELAVISVFRSMPLPLVVKPAGLGSSVGLSLAKDFNSLRESIRKAMTYSDIVLVEEFIKGREATCGVVENFRGKEIYSLLPVEIVIPESKELFDYEAKYSGQSQEICPGNFSPREMVELERLALAVHKIMGLRHYSRSDFIVTSKRGIYFLEVNTLPGLTNESLLPKALRAVGSGVPEFLDHVIGMALTQK